MHARYVHCHSLGRFESCRVELQRQGWMRIISAQTSSPVIPVLLPDAPDKPELPIFLKAMTWVDFRVQDPEPLSRLIWGITGQRPGLKF
jgi:hypothetical protein